MLLSFSPHSTYNLRNFIQGTYYSLTSRTFYFCYNPIHNRFIDKIMNWIFRPSTDLPLHFVPELVPRNFDCDSRANGLSIINHPLGDDITTLPQIQAVNDDMPRIVNVDRRVQDLNIINRDVPLSTLNFYELIPPSVDTYYNYSMLSRFTHMQPFKLYNMYDGVLSEPLLDVLYLNQHNVLCKYHDFQTDFPQYSSFTEIIKLINGSTLTIQEYNRALQSAIHIRRVGNNGNQREVIDQRFLKDKNFIAHNQFDFKLFLSVFETFHGRIYLPTNFVKSYLLNLVPKYRAITNPWRIRTDFCSDAMYSQCVKSQSILSYNKESSEGSIMSSKYDIDTQFFVTHTHYSITKDPKPIFHPHPNGHFGRAFLSSIIYNDAANCGSANTFWIHVGENPGRTLKHDRPGHILNCITDGYDYQRQTNYCQFYANSLFRTNIKHNRFTTATTMCLCGYSRDICTHVKMFYNHIKTASQGRIDGFTQFFVHSAYYVSLQPTAKYIYLIVNIYPKVPDGVTYPFNSNEGSWYRKDGKIYTKVNGNETFYSHPDFQLGKPIYSLDDIPDDVTLFDFEHRVNYHVDVLCKLPYSHNTEVAIRLSIVPFNVAPIPQTDCIIFNMRYSRPAHAEVFNLLGLSDSVEIVNLDLKSPYPCLDNVAYKYTNSAGAEMIYYRSKLVIYQALSKKYTKTVIDCKIIDREYNYYIKNLTQALFKGDEQAYKDIKLNQFTKHANADVYEYKDIMAVCDFLAAKLYVDVNTSYYPKITFLLYLIHYNMVVLVFCVVLGIAIFFTWFFKICKFTPQIHFSFDFLISPLVHMLDGKLKFDFVYQQFISRLLLLLTCYKLYVMNRSFIYCAAVVAVLPFIGFNFDKSVSIITSTDFILNLAVLFVYRLKDFNQYIKRHSWFIIAYVFIQLIVPSYSLPEYKTHCSFNGIHQITFDSIKLILNFFNLRMNFMYSKPTEILSFKRNKSNKPVGCDFDKHEVQHVTQICPNIRGNLYNNIPVQLHQCPVTSLSAASRNMIKRGDYDISSINSFKRFVDSRYMHYDFPALKEFLSKIQIMTVKEFITEHYTGSQLKEYQEAYDKLMNLCKPVQLSVMKSHVKTDELQYLTEAPKDRNITAQDSCSKIIMAYITYLSAKFYKTHDYSYSSGLNFAQREDRMEYIINSLIDPVEIDIDGSGYDSTQYDILKTIVDVPIYLYILKALSHTNFEFNYGATFHVLSNQLQNVYNMVLNSNYRVLGTVASGMMSTSDGNTRRSIMYIRYGLRDFKEGRDYFVEALGDDIKIISERKCSKLIVEALKREVYVTEGKNNLGQIAKYINIEPLNQGNFISTTTLIRENKREVKMVRQFDRVLSSFAFSIKVTNFKSLISHQYKVFLLNISKYYSMMDWCKGVTFYETLAQFHLRYAKFLASKYHFNFDLDNNILSQYRSKKDMTRVSYYKGSFDEEFYEHLYSKYNISRSQIESLIYKLRTADMNKDITSSIIDHLPTYNYEVDQFNYTYTLNKLNNKYRTFKNHIKSKSELFVDGDNTFSFPILYRYIKPTSFKIRLNVTGLGYEWMSHYYQDYTLPNNVVDLDGFKFRIPDTDKLIYKNHRLVGFPQEIIINLNESS